MELKKILAVACTISLLTSSMTIPGKVFANEIDGTIDAFDQASMDETRKKPKPGPSNPDEQPKVDINLTGNLSEDAFRASHIHQPSVESVGDAKSAFDGNETTRWQSGEASTFQEEWIEADLKGKSELSNLKLTFFGLLYGNFVVETSTTNDENASWIEVGKLDIPAGTTRDIVKTLDLKQDGQRVEVERFIRLRFTSSNSNAANRSIAIKEIEVNGLAKKETVTKEGNLALNKYVTASDAYGDYKAEYVNDGIFDDDQRALRWQSGEGVAAFKNVWLQVDLKTDSILENLKIKFDSKMYGNFILQTSDTGETWQDLETVSDVPVSNDVHISYQKTFAEPLQTKRYVRLYFTDVNTFAGNKSIAIRELELNGKQELSQEDAKPANANEVLAQVGALKLDEEGTQVVFPGISDDYTISLKGSDLKQIISNDAIVTNYNFYDYDVDVLVQAVNKNDPEDRGEKSMVLHVPNRRAYYPELFPEVANPNLEPKIIPSVQEWYGYNGDFVLSTETKIAVNDNHNLGLEKAAVNLQKDIKEYTGYDLKITTGEGDVNDIELTSLASDKYDTGKEGYILLNNDNGLKIYSNTYTGVFYGTMSVDQVFYQQRFAGNYSFPKGIIRDFPKFEVRGYMLDVARAPYRLERLNDYAKVLGFYKMNEFHVHLNDNMNQGNKGDWNIAKTLEGQFRLESDTFPSLESVAKDSEYYNTSEAFGGQPQYTKEEYIQFQKDAVDLGVTVMSEIDLPGHALLFNQYVEKFADEAREAGVMGPTRNLANAELLALSGENYENAKVFMDKLWDEYLGIDENGVYHEEDAVFMGDYVDIGADEYWGLYNHSGGADSEEQKIMQLNMLDYIRDVTAKVEATGKKVRVWGQLKQSADRVVANGSEAGFATKDLNNIVLDLWYNGYENVQDRINEGFKFVNINDSYMYGNPARDFRDIINAEYLFEEWTPNIMQGITVKKGEPGLLGASTALWADINRMGVTERDINERVIRAASVVAEKTWGGTDENQDYSEFSFKFSRLKNGPRVDIAKDIESKTDLVMDLDFANIGQDTVYDISGNNYHGTLTGGRVVNENGTAWLDFDGNTKIKTGIDSLSYPYTIQFDLKADNAKNSEKAILFDGYDGRLSVDANGNLVVDRSFFNENFNYQLKANEKTTITLVGTQQVTKLYVNGVFVDAIIRISNAEEDYKNVMGTFVFPLQTIGEGFHGQMANLKVYKKAMNPQEVKNSFENIEVENVNISQNKGVAGELRNGAGGFDDGNEKLHIAWKAIDGDGNTLNGSHELLESDKDSYFHGKIDNAYIALDFYKPYKISKINLQFDAAVANYQLYTSNDGVNWHELGTYSDSTLTFVTPIETQYLKLVGTNFKLREMEVYEAVNKAELNSTLIEAKELVNKYGLSFANKKDKADLFDAYMKALSISKNAYALQSDVDQANTILVDAIVNMPTDPVEPGNVDKTALQIAVDVAKDITNLDNVIPVVAKEFNAALQEANDVLANPNASQEEVDNAFTRLATSMHMLDFIKGNKDALQYLVAQIKNMNKDDYTEESWANIEAALEEARKVLADENAMQEEMDSAKAALEKAIDNLVEKADKSLLEAFYNKVVNTDSSKYTKTTFTRFTAALNDAQAVLDNEKATQTEVDNAYNALVKAYLDLRLIPNKDALKDLISKAKALNEPALANAIANAQAVLDNPEVSQEEIDKAYETLNNAINGLVKTGDKAPSAATGDNVNLVNTISLLGLSMAAYVAMKKENN